LKRFMTLVAILTILPIVAEAKKPTPKAKVKLTKVQATKALSKERGKEQKKLKKLGIKVTDSNIQSHDGGNYYTATRTYNNGQSNCCQQTIVYDGEGHSEVESQVDAGCCPASD